MADEMPLRGAALLARNWRVVAGLALMYLWTWLIYWGGPFSLRNYTIGLTNLRWGANVVCCAVGVVAVLALACGRGGARVERLMRSGSLACGLAGTGLGLLLALSVPLPQVAVTPVALASGVFTGLCEGLLLCQWCTATSALGMRAALSHNAAAMALGGLAFIACNAAPTWLSLAAGMACPPLWWAVSRGVALVAAVPVDAPGAACAPVRKALAPFVRDRSFLMLAGISLLFGFSNGFINAGFEIVPKSLYWVACYGVVVGTIAAAGLAFLAAFVLKMDAWQLVFRVTLPLMALAYLLFPYEAFWYVGWGVHALGYQFFFVALWPLLGSKQLRHDVPAARSVAAGLAAAQVGAAAGLLLWNAVCVGIDVAGERVVSGVAVMFVVLAAVTFERPRFGWGTVRPGAAPAAEALRTDDYRAVMERIRRDYGLSPREAQVCALAGRGRNRQFVADELGISLETVKSHVTNVYRKLGVHSQQELLDVIEMAQDTLARERDAAGERG